MSTPERLPLRAFAPRRSPRCPLAVPVRVTILRSGTSYSIPGRSLNLGEGGISVVLAGEVQPADTVGVEFLLPDLGLGLQAKAVVRHRSTLGYGFEFQGLTRHQQVVIREWSRQMLQVNVPPPDLPSRPAQPSARPIRSKWEHPWLKRLRRVILPVVALLALIALFTWWHWQKAWKELEEPARKHSGQAVWVESTARSADFRGVR